MIKDECRINNTENNSNLNEGKDSKILDNLFQQANINENTYDKVCSYQNIIKIIIYEFSIAERANEFILNEFKTKLLSDDLFSLSYFLFLMKIFELKNSENADDFYLFNYKIKENQKNLKIKLSEKSIKTFLKSISSDIPYMIKFFRDFNIIFYDDAYINNYDLYFLPEKKYFINILVNFPDKISNFLDCKVIDTDIYAYSFISEFYVFGLIDEVFINKISKLTILYDILMEMIFFFNQENYISSCYLEEIVIEIKQSQKESNKIHVDYFNKLKNLDCLQEKIQKSKIKIFQIMQKNYLDQKFFSLYYKELNSNFYDFYLRLFNCSRINIDKYILNLEKNSFNKTSETIISLKSLFFEYFLVACSDIILNLDSINTISISDVKNTGSIEILNFEKIFKKNLEKSFFVFLFCVINSPEMENFPLRRILLKQNKDHKINENSINKIVKEICVTFSEKFIEALNNLVFKNENFIENLNNSEFFILLVFLYSLIYKIESINLEPKNKSNLDFNCISHLNLVLTYQGKIMAKNLTMSKKVLFKIFCKSLKRIVTKAVDVSIDKTDKKK